MSVRLEDVTALLRSRCAVCWAATLEDFWASVLTWCAQERVTLEAGEEIRSVQNEQLRALLWTANRSPPTVNRLELAEAVRYEKAGGAPIPEYSHIATALRSIGQE